MFENMNMGKDGEARQLVLLGPPAAGKGTQAALLSERLGVPHVSTGAVIRSEIQRKTELGIEAAKDIDRGFLLSDDIVCGMVDRWLEENADGSGFIFDGFPRTVAQGKRLDEMLEHRSRSLDAVILIDVPRDVIEQRVLGRLQCATCGKVFNRDRDALGEGADCPVDGGTLVRRKDDTLEVLEERFREYEEKTSPLVPFYENQDLLVRIDGGMDPEEVFSSIMNSLLVLAR